MEFVDTWQTFANPNLAVIVAAFVAAAVTLPMAWAVVKVARKSGRFKPQSLLLLAVPALIIIVGAIVDDYREVQYRDEVTASGAVDASWQEIQEKIEAQYDISSVEPFGDQVELVNMAYEAAGGNPGPTAPLVEVQMTGSTHVEMYRLIVESTLGGADVSLARQTSAVRLDEGVDPEQLRFH